MASAREWGCACGPATTFGLRLVNRSIFGGRENGPDNRSTGHRGTPHIFVLPGARSFANSSPNILALVCSAFWNEACPDRGAGGFPWHVSSAQPGDPGNQQQQFTASREAQAKHHMVHMLARRKESRFSVHTLHSKFVPHSVPDRTLITRSHASNAVKEHR